MPRQDTLSILQYNTQKTRCGVSAEFFRDAANQNYSVVAFQEPWLNCHEESNITTHHPCGSIYELLMASAGRPRVCLFVNKAIAPSRYTFFERHNDLISLRLTHTEDDTTRILWIHNLYRDANPATAEAAEVLATWETALEEDGEHITVGDFNSHHPLWGGINTAADNSSGRIIEIIDRFALQPQLPQGTITRWGYSGQINTTIDLVLATPETSSRLISCDVHPPAEYDSDHRPILTRLQLDLPPAPQRTRRNWDRINPEHFTQTLEIMLPSEFEIHSSELNEHDIGCFLDRITLAMQTAIEAAVPETKITQYSRPGFPSELKEVIQHVKSLRRRWQASRDEFHLAAYNEARNHKNRLVTKTLTRTHRDKVEQACQDPNGVWKLGRWATSRGTRRQGFTPPIARQDGTNSKAEEAHEKADLLKASFFPKPPAADLSDMVDDHPPPIQQVPLTDRELYLAIRRAKAGKAPGPDGIPNQAIHLAKHHLVPLLLPIFDACIQQGIHPQRWKSSITISLRKPNKPDYSQPKAYRPIALLNTLGKILESIVATRLSYWVETQALLPYNHLGARRSMSVEHALHMLLEHIHSAFDTVRPVASLLSLDVSGAFDNVEHQRLTHNLRQRRCPEGIARFIENFLQGRSTTIKMPEFTSSPYSTPTGIPQGSPLSPILYLFYNADLVERTNDRDVGATQAASIGWVDDVNIVVKGETAQENCETLQRIYRWKVKPWATAHASVFAPEKFALVHFTKKKGVDLSAHLQLDHHDIAPSPHARVLGVILDSHLTYEPHLRRIEATATKRLNCLQALCGSTWGFTLLDTRKLYLGAVVPAMLFGSSVWYTPYSGQGMKTQENRIVKTLTAVQKRAAAIIGGAFRITAGPALNVELFLLPMKQKLDQLGGNALIRLLSSPVTGLIENFRSPYKRRPAFWSPLERLQTRWKELLADDMYEGMHEWYAESIELRTPFLVAPWWDGPEVIITGDPQAAIKEHDFIMAKKPYDTILAYTDGSAHDKMVGAGAVVLGPGKSVDWHKSVCLGCEDIATVYVAELEGIHVALQRMFHWQVGLAGPRELIIFTDNQAALKTMKYPEYGPGQFVLRKIIPLITSLKSTGLSITFRWIPAHRGVEGNEIADELAKAGADPTKYAITHLQWGAAGLQRMIKRLIAKDWERDWAKAKHGRDTYRLIPVPCSKGLVLHRNLKKALSSILIQSRTGKIALKKYLYDINRADDPYCDWCLQRGHRAIETVRHVMDVCPGYSPLRQQVFGGEFEGTRGYMPYLSDPSRDSTTKATKYMLLTRRLGQFQAVESPAA